MAYIPGFAYDIFISYSHTNNLHPEEEPKGWIEQFFERLKILLAQNYGRTDKIQVWWDSKRLAGNTKFDASIQEGIEKSAILLCLNSWAYLESEYCRKERAIFARVNPPEKMTTRASHNYRIINVLLNNIHYANWPAEFEGTCGFVFHDGKEPDDYGDPIDPTKIEFKDNLHELRDALVGLIDEMSKERMSAEQKEVRETEDQEQPFTIFMGEVTDPLRSTRKKIIAELVSKNFVVLPDVPPPYESAAHAEKVKRAIEKCDLSVHLLDQLPGKEIIDAPDTGYPQQQAQLGLEVANPKIIWIPTDLKTETIEDKPYKDFLARIERDHSNFGSVDFIRGYSSNLAREIIDIAESLKKKPVTKGEKVSVLLDTHYRDQLYAFDISKTLIENQIQPYVNPSEDDPHRNLSFFEDRISQVSKLIFLYGSVTREWVVERMSTALQMILIRNLPIQNFFIYMIPPLKHREDIALKQKFLKIDVIDNSNQPILDHALMNKFILDLKAIAP